MNRSLISDFIPPILWKYVKKLKRRKTKVSSPVKQTPPERQDLELYWDHKYALVLDEWGRDNTWNEIQMFLCVCEGKVLDIACGTGKTIELLGRYPGLVVYGFDISEVLIGKAIDKGIPSERLQVQDATKTNYSAAQFDYSYSIGSLEHFTLVGVSEFIKDCARYTRVGSFHMVPVSRSGQDEGWMKTVQSFHNNSEQWWYKRFTAEFRTVYVIPSKWEDKISVGRWYICFK
jgi:ubiquinone/menaquinone biosynthesis C-methylase UbiE